MSSLVVADVRRDNLGREVPDEEHIEVEVDRRSYPLIRKCYWLWISRDRVRNSRPHYAGRRKRWANGAMQLGNTRKEQAILMEGVSFIHRRIRVDEDVIWTYISLYMANSLRRRWKKWSVWAPNNPGVVGELLETSSEDDSEAGLANEDQAGRDHGDNVDGDDDGQGGDDDDQDDNDGGHDANLGARPPQRQSSVPTVAPTAAESASSPAPQQKKKKRRRLEQRTDPSRSESGSKRANGMARLAREQRRNK